MDSTARAMIGEATAQGYRPVTLTTPRGDVSLRWYQAGGGEGVAYVGGVGGGWDTPALGLYPALCDELRGEGVHGLRVRFRNARDLAQATYDLLAGAAFLRAEGVASLAFVGHSFGGAVAVRAASATQGCRAVVTLATQSYGTDTVRDLPPGCGLLLIHGERDTILPSTSSLHVFDEAHEPKRLVIVPGAGHVLDEAAAAVHDEVHAWLSQALVLG